MAKKNIVEMTPEIPEVPSALGYKIELKCKKAKQKEFVKSLNVKKKEICFYQVVLLYQVIVFVR